MVGYWLLTDKLPVFVDKACVSLLLWKRECLITKASMMAHALVRHRVL